MSFFNIFLANLPQCSYICGIFVNIMLHIVIYSVHLTTDEKVYQIYSWICYWNLMQIPRGFFVCLFRCQVIFLCYLTWWMPAAFRSALESSEGYLCSWTAVCFCGRREAGTSCSRILLASLFIFSVNFYAMAFLILLI